MSDNYPVTMELAVRERLKSIISELIPEERYDQLVRSAVSQFETEDLPKLVRAALTEKYKVLIHEEFEKPEWKDTWNSLGLEPSQAVKQLLVEAAPLLLASMVGGVAQSLVNDFAQRLYR